MADIKNGDRVRVTVEGLAHNNGTYTVVRSADDQDHWLAEYRNLLVGEGVTVEKIEPPVEVFKPGDVVRALDQPDYVYLVRPDGKYIYLRTTPDAGLDLLIGREFGPMGLQFTSERYERVDLG